MKIMCQEHYDEVVRYAERIGDKIGRTVERSETVGAESELSL